MAARPTVHLIGNGALDGAGVGRPRRRGLAAETPLYYLRSNLAFDLQESVGRYYVAAAI